ncbi:MAG: sarcosine oxidase subunit gamma SoxG [Desulfosarcinaceae bacterium]|nr:sarcosine oxidase subunit gamma SoxG [Desulfosarcinaceae bacterium]
MAEIRRESPVDFGVRSLETEVRSDWPVALAYDAEGDGPWVVDLSHKTRWDLQDGQVGELTPAGQSVPATPGMSVLADGILINRMNRTQTSIYHLGSDAPDLPDHPGFTDVTEATIFLALFGPHALHIAEKLSNLDLGDPNKEAPFLLQGPFCHVPCQIVTLEKDAEDGTNGAGGFVLTCSRGYAQSMVHAILDAGAEFGLRPAGEQRFAQWLAALSS